MSDNISHEIIEEIFSKRVRCDYNLQEQTIMKLRKKNVLNELEILKLTGKSVIYENQEIIASKVVTTFKNRKIINIMVLAKTQSGKTGSMCATIKQYLEDTSNLIPIENIYIITGLSSCEWKEQTKARMPESIQNRVFHRCELPTTFVDEIKDKQNILVIMDEIQVAAKKGQTIYNTFSNAGLLNKSKLYENDIKILEYTATPDGTLYDLMKWGDASTKFLADVGDGYVGSYDLLQQGRVKQFKDLCGYDLKCHLLSLEKETTSETLKIDCEKISKFIKQIIRDDIMCNNEFNKELFTYFIETNNLEKYNNIINIDKIVEIYCEVKVIFESIQEIKSDIEKFSRPLYHIIRTSNGEKQDTTIENFKQIFNIDNYNFIKYDKESEIEDINQTLKIKPKKHTIIFIKEMLRCAKTLIKINKGVSYERYSISPDDTTITQGLVGRDTGYDNNGLSICYTNIPSIEKYEKLWESGFEDKTIRWNSKTTKYINGILCGKNTFNDPKNYNKFSVASDDIDELKEPIIKKFKTQKEAKEYYNKELKEKMKGRGPNLKKPNENGFYLSTIGKGDNRTKVRTTKEIYDVRKWNLTEKTGRNFYTFYPCYEDINNASTLQWWFIHL